MKKEGLIGWNASHRLAFSNSGRQEEYIYNSGRLMFFLQIYLQN
jgi:hypothetical protein